MRLYTPPDKLEGETNQEWCDRYAAMIPAETLMIEVVRYMNTMEKRRGPAWSQLGQILGHGCGVSSAIVRRFTPEGEGL